MVRHKISPCIKLCLANRSNEVIVATVFDSITSFKLCWGIRIMTDPRMHFAFDGCCKLGFALQLS